MTAEQAVAAVLASAGAPHPGDLARDIIALLKARGCWRETPQRGPFDPFIKRTPDPPSAEYERRKAELWQEFTEHGGRPPPGG